ncbi:nucleotide-diphospho-sugar transferase [Polynucleobacter paneuropaeus]|nr:nucleotide-diphospho-sugar transferase [Polynucleobacter paneuropaeus]
METLQMGDASELPILLLIFNRPDLTKKLIESLGKLKPKFLYIAADGPRENYLHDNDLCSQARAISQSLAWPCEVKTLFRTENLGCRKAVSEAIDWFFDEVEEGVVLEDDSIVDLSFFQFSLEMLDKYRNDSNIVCISAQNFGSSLSKTHNSYYFSIYNHCWGWASWRRAWALYDKNMSAWPKLRDTSWLGKVGGGFVFVDYWRNIFNAVYRGDIDSWAYVWTFSCWHKSGLTIIPDVNLVKNIGIGEHGTRTNSRSPKEWMLDSSQLIFPLEHPTLVSQNKLRDQWTSKNIFKITFPRYVFRKMRRIFL